MCTFFCNEGGLVSYFYYFYNLIEPITNVIFKELKVDVEILMTIMNNVDFFMRKTKIKSTKSLTIRNTTYNSRFLSQIIHNLNYGK